MAIYDIKRSKELRKYGEVLKREGIALRVIQICKEIADNPIHYKNAIIALGRIQALALSCKFDCYWTEKRNLGFNKEYERALETIDNSNGIKWKHDFSDLQKEKNGELICKEY